MLFDLTLCISNVVFHSFGIYLLVRIRDSSSNAMTNHVMRIQRLLTVNMSVNELICNVITVAHRVFELAGLERYQAVHDAFTALFMVKLVFFYTVYLMIMIYITVDRFLQV